MALKIAAMLRGKKLDKRTLALIAGVALVVIGAGAGAAKVSTGSSTGADRGPTKPGCPYPPSTDLLGKSKDELIARTKAAIERANPSLKYNLQSWGGLSMSYSAFLAQLFVTKALEQKVPLEVVVAITHWETRGGFGDYSDVTRVQRSLSISGNGSQCTGGSELGPMQVKPCVLPDVGMSVTALANMKSSAGVLAWMVEAGVRYIKKLRNDYLPGYSWCDVIRAYNQGFGALKRGFTADQQSRADAYLAGVLNALELYSDLASA